MRSAKGLSKAVDSTIGVKQGCPLSPTLFGLYIDEVSHYIERFGGLGSCLMGIAVQILLYADDIVLISDSPEGLQRHLNALKLFCMDKSLSINMDKTVFNTTQAWVTRSELEFFLGEEKVEYTRSYTYVLGSPYGRLLVLDFLVDMQPLVLSRGNVHICSSKIHELSCGFLIHMSHQLFSME